MNLTARILTALLLGLTSGLLLASRREQSGLDRRIFIAGLVTPAAAVALAWRGLRGRLKATRRATAAASQSFAGRKGLLLGGCVRFQAATGCANEKHVVSAA